MGFGDIFGGLSDWLKNNQDLVKLGLTGAGLGLQLANGSGGDNAATADQRALNTFALSNAQKNIGDARATFQLPLDYWSKILSGDRGAALTAMAPQVNTITSQYDTAFKALNELAPRGGGRNAGMQDLAFKKAGDITNLINSARPAAATNVADIGSRIAALGVPSLSVAASGINSAVSSGLTQQQIDDANSRSLGSSIGTMIGILLGQKNSSTTTSGAQQDPFWLGRTTPPFNPNAGIGVI
jgi:hypothetical protein